MGYLHVVKARLGPDLRQTPRGRLLTSRLTFILPGMRLWKDDFTLYEFLDSRISCQFESNTRYCNTLAGSW